MRYVADTSAFLAVVLDEPERAWLVQATEGQQLVAPPVLPYEIANALSALVKRKALGPKQADEAWEAALLVAVELASIDIHAALALACKFSIYAYDAFFLQCALEGRCPLVTLDVGMKQVARKLNLALVEPT